MDFFQQSTNMLKDFYTYLQEVLAYNGFAYNGFAYNGFFEDFIPCL